MDLGLLAMSASERDRARSARRSSQVRAKQPKRGHSHVAVRGDILMLR